MHPIPIPNAMRGNKRCKQEARVGARLQVRALDGKSASWAAPWHTKEPKLSASTLAYTSTNNAC